MPKSVSLASIALCLTLLSANLRADDWLTGSGGLPDRSGRTSERGPYGAWLLWSGGGNSGFGNQAVIEGQRVFISRSGDDLIFAHDLATGRELWRKSLPAGAAGFSAVTAVHDGQVYATRAYGSTSPDSIYSLDAVDGSILWRSDAQFDGNYTDSPTFSAEGDPIVGTLAAIIRIDRATGHTVWSTPRQGNAGSSMVAVSGNRLYATNAVSGGIGVEAYDPANGSKLYSSAALTAGPYSFQNLFAGGGRVFAPMTQGASSDALVALLDNGSSLVELWRSALPNTGWSSFAIGPDGSVYSYSPAHEVLRINPATGSILNRSAAIVGDPSFFEARMAADINGTVYVTAGSVANGVLYAFDASLALRWSVPVPNVSNSGPAIGSGGTVVVSGRSQDIRAYRPSPFPNMPLRVDARAGAVSNANGVFEPGETVFVEPSWRNILTYPVGISGFDGAFTGPAGATYTSVDGIADYGIVSPGSTSNCFDTTGNCYKLSISNPATRPAAHWDATISEFVSGGNGNSRIYTLHIGKSFADVPTTSPQYKFVETIFHNGITAGCTTGNYCPDTNVTRAQMAVFLMRSKHGSTWNPPPARGTVFTDVPVSAFAAAWIERMPFEGISTGCGGGMYCPDANTTRAQMSVFLLRAHDGMSYNPPACTVAPFTDVPCSSPYATWIAELVRRGVAAGCGAGKYCPDDPVTRGQMAVFLTTTFGLQLYAP